VAILRAEGGVTRDAPVTPQWGTYTLSAFVTFGDAQLIRPAHLVKGGCLCEELKARRARGALWTVRVSGTALRCVVARGRVRAQAVSGPAESVDRREIRPPNKTQTRHETASASGPSC